MCEWHSRMSKQIEEIPSIVSTKNDVLLLIREAKYKLKFSESKTAEDFLDAKFHNMS